MKLIRVIILCLLLCKLTGCTKDSTDTGNGPYITSFDNNPVSGSGASITGLNFGATPSDNMVTVNGQSVAVNSVFPSGSLYYILYYTFPAGITAGSVTVSITVNSKTSTSSFFYFPITGVSTFAGSTAGFIDGNAATAKFQGPNGMVTDAAGNFFICDQQNNRIRKITKDGVVTTFAGNGTAGAGNGPGATASFNAPEGIAIDRAGNFYVSDALNYQIRKITPDGTVSTYAGSGTKGTLDGASAAAQFVYPAGMAFDAAGNLYVADMLAYTIRKITPSGMVTTFSGNGIRGHTDGSAANAQFKKPTGITVNTDGNIYVTDQDGQSIRKINAAGDVSIFAGNGIGGTTDGKGTLAFLYGPNGITHDEKGNLYITEAGNHRVRIIGTDGYVTSLTKGSSPGYTDGAPSRANFSTPSGIALDATGNIYLADSKNNRIRKLGIQ